MKKVLAAIGLASLGAISLQAQGLVIFSGGAINISTNNSAGVNSGNATIGKTQGAGNYYYALFSTTTPITTSALVGYSTVGATPDASSFAWNNASTWTLDTDTSAVAASTATAGRFAATTPNPADGSSTIVPTVAGGTTTYFEVVGWSANLGTSIAQLEASLTAGVQGYVGESPASGGLTLGNGLLIPTPNLFAAASPALQGFQLGPVTVPEPGTLALAAIGGASLLAFRRKK